ncbi:MAG: hypothetical protein AB1297_07990, partial [bacterium]
MRQRAAIPGVIFCEVLPPGLELDKERAGVAIHLRLTLYVEIRVGKRLYKRVSLSNIEFFPQEREFLLFVENKGNDSCLTSSGSLTIKARRGGISKKLSLLSNRYTLFRNSSRIFRAKLDSLLPDGEYRLIAFIPYEGKYKTLKSYRIKAEKGDIAFLEEKEEQKGVSLEIEPCSIELSIPQKGFRTGIIKLSNKEEEVISFSLSLRDVTYKEENLELLPSSSRTTYSLIPFIEIFPTSLRLEPKRSGVLRYKVFVPKEEEGGKYSAGSIFAITSGGKKEDFILPIELTIQKTEKRQLIIENIKPISSKKLSFLLKNGGNVLERGTSASLLIKDTGGKLLHN